MFDLTKLAAQAQEVSELPRVTREGVKKDNPLLPLVKRSFDDDSVITLPPVSEGEVKRIVLNLRYAARDLQVGCDIRKEITMQGIVITFAARERNYRYA